MKVLILHQHFNTPEKGGAIRSYYLAKALIDEGIQVTVITCHNQKKYKKELIEGIEVHYLAVPYDNRFGFMARSNSFIKYVLEVIIRSGTFKDVDVCYAMSVPLTVGLAAMWLKVRYKIRFVFEVGDLWPDAPIQMGFIKNSIFKSILYRLEKKIYMASSAIVALSPAILGHIGTKVNTNKVYLIPNMADTEFYKPTIKSIALEKRFGTEGKFVVSYMGALGVANGLDFFLECARASERASLAIHFILCGDGAMKENLKKSAALLGLNNLSFIPFQNREGVREIMQVTDAVFVCYKPVPILETGSPNKYFDGLAAGKLIIINFGGWIEDEIIKNKCGINVNPKHPTDFIQKISPLLSEEQMVAYGLRARALAESKYSRPVLGSRFTAIFNSI